MSYRIRKRKPLTIEEQVSITTDYNAGMPIKDIEKKYQVSATTIHNMVHKEIN